MADLEAPFGVMIKVRDSAAGVFKHKHLGQVIVPISCFIYQTEATFCLPLESTTRMEGDRKGGSAIGQIHLTTQLMSLDAGTAIKGNSKAPFLKKSAGRASSARVSREVGSIDNQGQFTVSESISVSIGFSLRRASAWTTWWPMRVLTASCWSEIRGHVCLK